MYSGKFVEKISKKKNRYEDDDQPMSFKKFKSKDKRHKRNEDDYEFPRNTKKTNR